MSEGMSFRFNGGQLLSNVSSMNTRFKASMGLYADTSAKKLENYAKKNKPWTNRTYDARNRLNATWQWRGAVIRIELSHGVDYGLYLEKGTPEHTINGRPWLYWPGASHPVKVVHHPGSKAYPIIWPTIEHCSPEIMAGLHILLSK